MSLAKVSEDHVALLVPYLVVGLGRETSEDFCSASLMALGVLARRTTLTAQMASGMYRWISRPAIHCPMTRI